jgi:hypothetical protein
LFKLFRSEFRGLRTVALADVVQGLSDSFAQVFPHVFIRAGEVDTLAAVTGVGVLYGVIVYFRVEQAD